MIDATVEKPQIPVPPAIIAAMPMVPTNRARASRRVDASIPLNHVDGVVREEERHLLRKLFKLQHHPCNRVLEVARLFAEE